MASKSNTQKTGAEIFSLSLKLAAGVIRDLESKIDDPSNITNWIAQLLGNSKVKYEVKTTIKVNGQDYVQTTKNFQPARNLSHNAWVDVSGDKGDAPATVDAYEGGLIPNAAKEICALVGYLVTCNLVGKPISAVSGGRSLMLDKIFKTVKPESVTVVVTNTGSGGQGDKFTLTLDTDMVKSLVTGALWRGKMVESLKGGRRSVIRQAFAAPRKEDWE